jgi:flagellar motor switch/type III secretory pathway protein FliN
MATGASTGLAQATERRGGEAAGAAVRSAESEAQSDELWRPVLGLGCELTVDLPMPGFKIADLLKLHKGSIINAHWRVGRDVPLCLNTTLIGWIEFEMVGGNLAVRLTELA